MKPVIQFQSVSKRYLLGSSRAYAQYLLPEFMRNWVENRKERSNGHADPNELWALKDVTFDAYPGEVVGLIGPNGAGKTTALSLLAGITQPTSGKIVYEGRVGALIKLGAGFHPDLTGKENIYLNGAILGLRRAEIDEIYDKIVAFSELERFIDTPVKRYSSGMYIRLGFSVAIHINPEILLVDEILSVGDVSFQSKSLNRIGEIKDSGKTIIFVSHNMHNIASFCDRVVYLDQGKIKVIGEPGEVLSVYTNDVMKNPNKNAIEDGSDMSKVVGSGRMAITEIVFRNDQGECVDHINSGESVTVEVSYRTTNEVEDPLLDVVIRDSSRGNMFQATNRDFGVEFGKMGKEGKIKIRFEKITSNNQLLNFFFTLWNSRHTERYDWKRYIKLSVGGNPTSSGRILFDCDWNKEITS